MTAKVAAPFSILDRLRYADETLRNPPKWEWVKRTVGRGVLVQRFVLPLEYCLTSNARMRGGIAQRRAEAAIKKRCGELMLLQANGRKQKVPLSGRPQVIAIRFTSKEADATSDWAKLPIDRLLVKGGLGYLVDDAPRYCEVSTSCEYAPPSQGFVLVELWSGESA